MSRTPQQIIEDYDALTEDQRRVARGGMHVVSGGDKVALPPVGDDVGTPITNLMIASSVLGTAAERDRSSTVSALLTGSGSGVAAIESTATALAKWWSAAAGGTGILAGLSTWLIAASNYWATSASVAEKVVIIGSAGTLLVSIILSIALMVSFDVRARSVASAAQYHARARIANGYVRAAADRPNLSTTRNALLALIDAAQAGNQTVQMKSEGCNVLTVKEVCGDDGLIAVRASPNDNWTPVPAGAAFSLS
jgi:hypothetical protein